MTDYAGLATANIGQVGASADYRAQEIYVAVAQVFAILDLAAAVREADPPVVNVAAGIPNSTPRRPERPNRSDW